MLSRIAARAATNVASAARSGSQKKALRFMSQAAGKTASSRTAFGVMGAATAGAATWMYWANETSTVAACLSNSEQDSLAKRVSDLEVTLAGKTQAAFVFIKPHACNEKVQTSARTYARHASSTDVGCVAAR